MSLPQTIPSRYDLISNWPSTVADLLGLSQRTAVSVYQRRYPDMPRPVLNLGGGRTRLWLRPEIEAWGRERRKR